MAAPGRGVILAGSVFGLGGLWLGVSTARLLTQADPEGYSTGAPAKVAILLAAGWALIASGVATLHIPSRRTSSGLRVLAGIAWFVALWNTPAAGAAQFAVSLIGAAVTPVLVGHATLRDRGRTLSAVSRPVITVGYATTAGAGLLGAAFFDPVVQGCSDCPANPWSIASSPTMVEVTGTVAVMGGALWSTALTALVIRLAVRRGAFTAADLPAMLPTLIYLGAVAAGYWHAWGDAFLPSDTWIASIVTIQAVALVIAGVGSLWSPIHRRLVRVRVGNLVARFTPAAAAGGLQDLLADVLGDPSVRMWYPLTSGVLVNAEGHPTAPDPTGPDSTGPDSTGPDPERELVPLTRRGQVLAVLSHEPWSLARPDLVDAIAATASLRLDAERLRAERRWQLLELGRSRQRIEEAGAAERRRLERDLHDGAQQHLVTAAIAVSLAMIRTTDPERSKALEQVRRKLDDATADLRDAAQGLRAGAPLR